jgi:hypothetical protein
MSDAADRINVFDDTPEMIADLLRMANEAEKNGQSADGYFMRESVENLRGLWALAKELAGLLKKERERCAKICEQLQDWPEGATPYDCAQAIRSAE